MDGARPWRLPELKDPSSFEAMCRELFTAHRRPRVEQDLHGRPGQRQDGLDFLLDLDAGLEGFQCKCRLQLAMSDITEDLQKLTCFPLPLRAFTVLTTAARDQKVQTSLLRLNIERRARGEIPVGLLFWDTICDVLVEHPQILQKYFAGLVPDLDASLRGRARRLEKELPGTRLTYRSGPDHTEVTVHPGPSGIPVDLALRTPEAKARLQTAMRQGTAVVFDAAEADFLVPDALESVLGRPRAKGGARSTLTITPSLNHAEVSVRLMIESRAAHHDLAAFIRRGKRSTVGIPAKLKVLNFGTERQLIRVQPDVLPFSFTVETSTTDPGGQELKFQWSLGGAAIHLAVEARALLVQLCAGAFIGVFPLNGPPWAVLMPARADLGVNIRYIEVLGAVAQAADWDIVVPDSFDPAELHDVESLLTLFREGRRVLSKGGTVSFTLRSLEQVEKFQALMASGGVIGANLREPARQIQFLGQPVTMPATVTRIPSFRLPDEFAALNGHGLPFEVRAIVPEDVEVVEELSEVGRDEMEPSAI